MTDCNKSPDESRDSTLTISEAMNRVCGQLPNNWQIHVQRGGAKLLAPHGAMTDLHSDGNRSIAGQIEHGIELANEQAALDFNKVAEHILDEILHVTYKNDPPFDAEEAGRLRTQHITRIAARIAEAALVPDVPKITAALTLWDALNRVCEKLPNNWQIHVELERGWGGANLVAPDGTETDLVEDSADSIAGQLLIGVDHAIELGNTP